MKRKLFSSLFFSLLFVSAVLLPAASAETRKTKIAVLDFQLQGGKPESFDMGKIVAEWLITALVKEGRFDVIERRLLEKVLEEQKMGATGLVDESSASKLGKVLGAKIVITGSVLQFQNLLEVNARIIEVESSSIVAAESVKSASAAKLEDLVVQMADKIISDFPLKGYIVQREGKTVLIDLGKRSGVKKGMQFIVFQEGNVIKHPKTGEILERERIETGLIEVKEIKANTSSASIVREVLPDTITPGHLVKSDIEPVILENAIEPEEPLRRKRGGEPREAVEHGDLVAQLPALNGRIEDIRQLKDSGSSAWKVKYREVLAAVKSLERTYRRSPEVELAYGKLYLAIGKPSDAEKFARRALSLRPNYGEAYLLKGDIDYDTVKKMNPKKQRKMGYGKKALQNYEQALRNVKEDDVRAMIYYKLGAVHADLEDDRDRAKEYWRKAVNIAPGSEGARLAGKSF